jgi:hypothetical protein
MNQTPERLLLMQEQLSFLERLARPKNLEIIPLESDITARRVRELAKSTGLIVATDFPIVDTDEAKPMRDDSGQLLGYYFPSQGLVTIDHHFNVPDMEQQISATNLMIRLVKMMANHASPARAQVLQML